MLSNHLFDKGTAHLTVVLRYYGYVILCLILIVAYLTDITIEFKNLFYIPFIALALYLEKFLLKKIEYYYGKASKIKCVFFLDIFYASLFLTAIQALLLPSFILVCSLIFIALFTHASVLVLIISPLVMMFTFYLSSIIFFGFQTHYLQAASNELNLLCIICFMIFISICMYHQRYVLESLKKEKQYYNEELNRYLKLNNQLAKYAPMQLWQSIMRGEVEAKVEYKRRKLTIFFSDIQGFTDLSESLIPDDLAFLLNDYLKHMTEIAKHYGGTIDKFMGDGILIFFGDPSSRGEKEDAIACLDMAVAMRQQMRILRERWIKMGYASLNIRMGIATGYCHVGNYGTAHRMSYTIVGRDANLAARLQTAAEIDQILISEATFNLVKEQFLCVKHKPLRLKGISNTVRSWQVVERYHETVDKYRRWYDHESKGFNLLLNLDKTPIYEYPQLIEVMQQTIDRIKLQQSQTDEEGAVFLSQKNVINISPQEKKD